MALTWVKIANLKGPRGDVGVWYKGWLPNGTDLNTFPESGRYGIRYDTDADTMVNRPAGATAGFFENTVTDSGIRVQTWTNYFYNTGWRRTTKSVVNQTFTDWGSIDVDAKAYADTQDVANLAAANQHTDDRTDAYRATDRALWRTEDDGHQAAAEANAQAYVDGKKFVPSWLPATAYAAGARVIAPNGDTVSAKTGFTSGASYDASKWNASTQDGRIGALEPLAANAVPFWKATTPYIAGQRVIAPNGDVVSAVAAFTSGAAYDAANWTASSQDGRLASVETKKVDGSDPRVARAAQSVDYLVPFVDSAGYVSGGVQGDGVWNFEKSPRVKGRTDLTFRPLGNTGWAIPFVDAAGYVAGGIRPDGTAEFFKVKLPLGQTLADANLAAGYTRSNRSKVAAIGDSLTDGYFGAVGNQDADSYPTKLQALMPAGVTVYNLGNSGYTVDEEAVRIGAIPLPLTVTGGSIPASGPVDVTTTAVIGWRPSGTTRTIPGTLAGVPGTVTRTNSDTVFTFTRTATGSAVAVSGAPVFVPDMAGHEGDTAVILLGRNNVSFNVPGPDASVAEHVAKGIARIVAWLKAQVKNVLVISNTTTTAETSGTSGYAIVADINARLLAAYPTRFLDLRAYLVNQAIYDLGITPTAADTTAMAADTLPPSIMDDNTHWSKATAVLVAAQVNNYLTTRGWV